MVYVKHRLQAIGEARVVFEGETTRATAGRAVSGATPSTARQPVFNRTWWLLAGGALVVTAGAFALWQRRLTGPG